MNMNNNPTKEQLKDLLAKCNDNDGSHILWVNRLGEVQITALYGGSPSAWTQKKKKDILFQHPSISQGSDFVGPVAADDQCLVSDMFDSLLVYWRKALEKEISKD
jgi:hypothetical protein